MRSLRRAIQEREAAIGADRRLVAGAAIDLRAGVRRQAAKPAVVCAFFGGGIVMGYFSGKVRARPGPAVGRGHSRPAVMVSRITWDVLWPVVVGMLRVRLGNLLFPSGGDQSRR